jgi:hypothetical protein
MNHDGSVDGDEEDATMSKANIDGAELAAIDAMGTLAPAEVASDPAREAFLAGFQAARSGKKSPRAPRVASRPVAFAFRHGVAYARIQRSSTATEAYESFLSTEVFWANSAMQVSIEKYCEAKASRVNA